MSIEQELGVAHDACLDRLKAALITKARLRNQVEVAKRIVLAGVELMPLERLGKWAGVRTFLEQDTNAYEPLDAPDATKPLAVPSFGVPGALEQGEPE